MERIISSTITKVDKHKAKKVWEKGKPVFLQSSKLPFTSFYKTPCQIQKPNTTSPYYDFETQVGEFEMYNCDWKHGYYSHFYVKTEDLKDE